MANEKPAEPSPPGKPDWTRCTPAQAADLLREAGATVEAAWIAADVAAGCPMNGDGSSLNLIVYAAWLLQKGEP